jgi:hypothetical protein
MKRILSLSLFLLSVCAPAYAAPATHKSIKRVVRTNIAKRPIKTHANTATRPLETNVSGMNANMPVRPTTLMGQLVYDEVEPPAPDQLAGTEESYSSPSTNVAEQIPEQEVPVLKQGTTRFSGSRRPAPLKGLSSDSGSCRSLTSEQSWVTELTEAQSSDLADSIAAFLARVVPAESTIVLLAPPPKQQRNNPFTSALGHSLRLRGFGLVEAREQAPDAKVLRYQVSAIDGGLVVQIRFNQIESNRFYSWDSSNGHVAIAPFCVREVR